MLSVAYVNSTVCKQQIAPKIKKGNCGCAKYLKQVKQMFCLEMKMFQGVPKNLNLRFLINIYL